MSHNREEDMKRVQESKNVFIFTEDFKDYCVVTRDHCVVSSVIWSSVQANQKSLIIPGVQQNTLNYIAEYITHHAGHEPDSIPAPLRSNNMLELCPDVWDAHFMSRVLDAGGEAELKNLAKAASILGMNKLMALCGAQLVILMRRTWSAEDLDAFKQGTKDFKFN